MSDEPEKVVDPAPRRISEGERRIYYNLGRDDGIYEGMKAASHEELLGELTLRNITYWREADVLLIEKTRADAYNAGIAEGLERGRALGLAEGLRQAPRRVVVAPPAEEPPKDRAAPTRGSWWPW